MTLAVRAITREQHLAWVAPLAEGLLAAADRQAGRQIRITHHPSQGGRIQGDGRQTPNPADHGAVALAGAAIELA